NAIDEFGGAHPQHLGNLIKTLHRVRFLFARGNTAKDNIRDYLSPTWKRTIINCCLVAVIYGLENGVDFYGGPLAKKSALRRSFDYYVAHSLHKDNACFVETFQYLSGIYSDQRRVF